MVTCRGLRLSLLVTLASLSIGDGILHLLYGYPWFGSWSWFTYSGMFAIQWFGYKRLNIAEQKPPSFVLVILLATIGYWLWTNFGTWWLGGLYPHTVQGIIACYTMALPFLSWSLLGNLVWSGIILGLFGYVLEWHQIIARKY